MVQYENRRPLGGTYNPQKMLLDMDNRKQLAEAARAFHEVDRPKAVTAYRTLEDQRLENMARLRAERLARDSKAMAKDPP